MSRATAVRERRSETGPERPGPKGQERTTC
jgi:hypothetical protein